MSSHLGLDLDGVEGLEEEDNEVSDAFEVEGKTS